MLLKFSFHKILLMLLLFTAASSFAQRAKKVVELLEEKDFSKAISMMKKDYFNGKEEMAYYIGEA